MRKFFTGPLILAALWISRLPFLGMAEWLATTCLACAILGAVFLLVSLFFGWLASEPCTELKRKVTDLLERAERWLNGL